MLKYQDIIPLPNARPHASLPIFPIPSERSAARLPLEILDRGLAQTQGSSERAHATLKDLRPFLDQSVITNL